MDGRLSLRLPLALILSLLMLLSFSPSIRAGEATSPASPEQTTPASPEPQDWQAVLTRIDQQNRELKQELRQVKREMAILNQNLEAPGLKEIITGVGFLFGLFGAAALVAARRRDRQQGAL